MYLFNVFVKSKDNDHIDYNYIDMHRYNPLLSSKKY